MAEYRFRAPSASTVIAARNVLRTASGDAPLPVGASIFTPRSEAEEVVHAAREHERHEAYRAAGGIAAGATLIGGLIAAGVRSGHEREQAAMRALGSKSISDLTRQELIDLGLGRYADYGVQPEASLSESVSAGAFPAAFLAAMQGVPVERVVVEGHPVLGVDDSEKSGGGFWSWLGGFAGDVLKSPVVAAAILGAGALGGGVAAGVGSFGGGVAQGLGTAYLGEQIEDLTEFGLDVRIEGGAPASDVPSAGGVALTDALMFDLALG